MSALTLLATLKDARTRWLGGDTQAWVQYAECCLKIEAELRNAQRNTAAPDEPRAPRRPQRNAFPGRA